MLFSFRLRLPGRRGQIIPAFRMRLFPLTLALVLSLLSVNVGGLLGQTRVPEQEVKPVPYDFYARGPWRQAVPRPSALLGYEPGEFHTSYEAYERVVREMARGTDRLRTFRTGTTPERRALYLHAVSSPANLARLDDIKANVRRLADPRASLSDAERERLIAKTPLILWLAYSIHGDESAGFEAGMHVLYQLLASDDPALRSALDNVVVLLNPCQNPDGHERFVVWYNAHGRGRAEPFAWEKENPWNVSGRLNHAYFDLNRDLLALSQPESRAAAAALLEWQPQVVADLHGETPSYFFPPSALPINPNLPRAQLEHWLEVFGRGNAKAFDRHGWMYFVRDTFDVFYPGYWDSWPSLHGATGMTYETEGGGKLGLRTRRRDGTDVTLRESIAMHVTASLATLETAAHHRAERLRDFRDFFVTSLQQGGEGPVRRFVFPPAADPGRLERLMDVLTRNGVEIGRLAAPAEINDVHAYDGVVEPLRTFPAGTLTVDLAQPRGRVARALLERDSAQDTSFLERQEEKRRRNEGRGEKASKAEYDFYDFTAWSLPLAFGVEAYWTDDVAAKAAPVAAPWTAERPPAPAVASSAYVFSPESEAGYRLAFSLLAEGFRVGAAIRPLRAANRTWPRGTFVVRIERNPALLHERIAALARQAGVSVAPVNTAYIDEGITGIGSGSVVALKRPQIVLLAGEPTQPSSYGSLRAVIEDVYGFDVVPVSADTLSEMPLEDFHAVVLPHGSASAYRSRLGDDGLARLRAWIERGGTLVAVGGAARFLINSDAELTTAKVVGADEPRDASAPSAAPAGSAAETAATPVLKAASSVGESARKAEPEMPRKPLAVPGAILRTEVDRFHFLTFGIESPTLPVLVEGDLFLQASTSGTNVLRFPAQPDQPVRLAGFVWKDNTEPLIRGTAAVIEEPIGDGRVVLMSQEPGLRLVWHASTKVLMNALLYGPAVGHAPTGD